MKNIFISSTFRDMQAERDMVQEKVLPVLREEAKKYGDNVGVIDLRWGVDTSALETDEGSAKVLTVCLDEIDRSHPYMLIFLGERYGWIPNGSLIEKAVRDRGDKYVTDDFEKSVTALEIEYGALSELQGDLSRCIVCFREPVVSKMNEENYAIYAEQNEKGIQKLEELKKRIRKELGEEDRLISYTCTWDESALVLKDFVVNGELLEDVLVKEYIKMFEKDWEKYKNLSWQEKEQLGFCALMESKLRTFVGRETLLEEYYQMVVLGNKPIILRGEVGSGKTALMSKLIDRMQKEGKKVFAFFCGMGSMSKNADSLVRQMIYYIETQLSVDHISENESDSQMQNNQNSKSKYDLRLEYLQALCNRLEHKVYIYIDALDQLSKDEHVENLDFFFGTEKVQMIASCTDAFKLSSSVKLRTECVDIPMLTVEDAKQVAEGILRAESRDYFAELEAALLAKKSIGSPLYISLLIQRLNMMDQRELSQVNNAEEIVAYGAQVIAEMPDNQAEAAVAILKNAIKKISGQPDGLLLEVVRFLAVSRNGLNKSDLIELFHRRGEELPALDFTLLMKYLDGFFYTGEEDRVNFTHKVIRTGILEGISNRSLYEKEIKEYLKTLNGNEHIYIQEGMYFARITEDYEFASQIIDDAYKTQDSILVRAITEDVVNDEAAFFNKLLFESPTNTLRWCIEEKIIPTLDFSRKEMRTKIVLLKSVIGLKEMMYEQSSSDGVARDLIVDYHDLGHSLKQVGEADSAINYYKKALEYAEIVHEIRGNQDSLNGLAASYTNIGHALKALGQVNEAIQYHKKALEYVEELYEKSQSDENKLRLAIAYENIGHLLVETQRANSAIGFFKKGLEYKESLHEKRQTDENLEELCSSYEHMGYVLRNVGQFELATSYCEKSLKGYEYLYQKKKTEKRLWSLSISYSNMGHALRAEDKPEEALVYYEKSKKCKEELYESQKSTASLRELVICYNNIGTILIMLDMPEEALKYYEKCFEQAKALHEELQTDASYRELAYSYDNMGDVLTTLKRYEEAINYYGEAMKCRQALYEKQKNEGSLTELSLSYGNMSQAMWKLRYYDYAINYLISQINCNEALFNALHTRKSATNLLYSYENIINALRALHRDSETELYEQNALRLREALNKSKED